MAAGPNGQRIDPVYIAAKELSPGVWSSGTCFMHQIVVRNCAVDLNLNGLADPPDIEWYLEDFAASLPEADLTTDGMVNSDDLDVFVEAYLSGE
ncbi:MAG: hypothetical protein JNL50_14290 [Phycisphaerae bacterium]|nr:hypothetical protein [Phycisphaerae bacterium]